MEYKANVASPLINGEAVSINIENKSLVISSLFDTAEVFFYEINAVRTADYKVFVVTDHGNFVFEKMGQWCEPFYKSLREAYQVEMRKALFVSGSPLITAKGEFSFIEGDGILNADVDSIVPVYAGKADIELYDNCLCFLTGDTNSRRVPLCFLKEIKKEEFEFTFVLTNGASYICKKLGYDTDIFEKTIAENLANLRKKSSELIKEIDSSLTSMQLSRLSKDMIEGSSVPFSLLHEVAPSIVGAIETKIGESRIAETFEAFKSTSNNSKMHVGIKKEFDTEETMLWLMAPSMGGETCAVEFVGTNEDTAAATFIYKYSGEFEEFASKLNYSLEAIEFKRNVLRMPLEELTKPENSHFALAIKVNKSLNMVRACYQDRIIHSSVASWADKLKQFFKA